MLKNSFTATSIDRAGQPAMALPMMSLPPTRMFAVSLAAAPTKSAAHGSHPVGVRRGVATGCRGWR